MREFTEEEKYWLVDNKGRKPLYVCAGHFKCIVADVYTNYSLVLESGEYFKIKAKVLEQRRKERERKENFITISLEAPES